MAIKHFREIRDELAALPRVRPYGRVAAIQGLLVEVRGPTYAMAVGARLMAEKDGGQSLDLEIVGFRGEVAQCLPFGSLDGLRLGAVVWIVGGVATVRPSDGWLGRVIDAFGRPIDGKGRIAAGTYERAVRASPPPAAERQRVGGPIDLGVRSLNTFATCCLGQRIGIFAGSGVGKSVLLSMLARYTACDVAVIGLIGERGREVQEFIEDDLGADGLARSVVVVATSDEPALMRRQAAQMTMAIAEHFRDEGKDVLCLMDSVTRFAIAQREIGLSVGEPPTTKGYTPTVFTELPRLLERAGPGLPGTGSITGIFTVLVEGDDHNEPVADAVRGILDGHVVMERAIAERGRYPAINILRSVSRTMPGCVPIEQRQLLVDAKRLMATYTDMEELIRLGAYRKGSAPEVDDAIAAFEPLENFLRQQKDECTRFSEGYRRLANLLETAVGYKYTQSG